MKNTTRLVLGVLSSLFLAVGLARAADRLDPVRLNTPSANGVTASAPDCTQACASAPDCTQACAIADDLT